MSLQWTLDIDVANGGAGFKQAVNYFKQLRDESSKINAGFSNFKQQSSSAFAEFDKLPRHNRNLLNFKQNTSIAINGITSLATVAVGAIVGAVAALNSVGDKLIGFFSERNASLRTYTTLLGDAKQAEKEYFKAGVLAQKTDLTQQEIQSSQQRLITQGFRGKELDNALLSVADVGTSIPAESRKVVLNAMLNAFKKLKGRGTLKMAEMKELGRGVRESYIVEELAQIKGVSVKDLIGDPTKKGKSRGMLSRGLVSGEEGMVAVQRAILRQFNTKKLGEYATGGSGDLKALLTNEGEAWENLAKSFDPKKLTGVQKYTESLKNLVNTIYDAEKGGGDLKVILQEVGNTFANVKGIIADFTAEFLKAFSESYIKQLEDMGYRIQDEQKNFDDLSDAAKNLGNAMGGVGKWFAEAKVYLEDLAPTVDKIRVMFQYLGDTISGIGTTLSGLKGVVTTFIDDFTNRGDDVFGVTTEGAAYRQKVRDKYKDNISKIFGGSYKAASSITKAAYTPFTHQYEKPSEAIELNSKNLTAQQKIEDDKKKNELKKSENIKEEKGVVKDLKDVQKGGDRIPGFHLGQFAPNYGKFKPLNLASINEKISQTSDMYNVSDAFYRNNSSSSTNSTKSSSVHVDNINIKVDSGAMSAHSVAEAVYEKFVSQVNRLSRVPSKEVL